MRIDQIRIYAEVLEQGLDFKNYIARKHSDINCINIYTKKGAKRINSNSSLIDKIRAFKDVDVLVTVISDNCEYPLAMIEYSTAVPTDDHKMQRSDVYFWGAAFKVPVIKISPNLKGLNQDFGGGTKFSDELEIFVAHRMGALFFPIVWNTILKTDILQVNPKALSCIAYSNEIENLMDLFVSKFIFSSSYSDYYCKLNIFYCNKYANIINNPNVFPLNYVKNSSRFDIHNGKVCVKINRFGHAMDPDRGVLYFANMLVGCDNVITEFQIQRKSFVGRGGYNALFDALPYKSELIDFVKKHIYNITTNDNDAINLFARALKLEKYISIGNGATCSKIANGVYQLDNDALTNLLENHTSNAAKSIFFLSSELRLTDIDRHIICKIIWDPAISKKYITTLSNVANYGSTEIEPLNSENCSEDIVTYASVELYKKLDYNLLAVSYPGAQGDRCILIGQGRKAQRKYIDIIAYKSINGIEMFLEECKSEFNKALQDDACRLLEIKHNQQGELYKGLVLLANKTANISNISDVFISVGAKCPLSNTSYYNVDYIFMFEVNSTNNNTIINYNAAISNMKLYNDFLKLSQNRQTLNGQIILDKIFKIK